MMRRWNGLEIAYLFLMLLATLSLLSAACGDDESENDDEVEDEDKEQVLCNKIGACGFEEELEIDDCADYAKDISDWLMSCAMKADGCRALAECFNLPEGV